MKQTISAGNVVRWFCIDWKFFGGAKNGTEVHDQILDELLNMRNAVEANSGHTGVNVAIQNTQRSNQAIIAEIKRRISRFASESIRVVKVVA